MTRASRGGIAAWSSLAGDGMGNADCGEEFGGLDGVSVGPGLRCRVKAGF